MAGDWGPCACGGVKIKRAQMCRECRNKTFAARAHIPDGDARKRFCACGAVMWRTSTQCAACRLRAGYHTTKRSRTVVAPRTPAQWDFQLFLMQQRHRLRQSFTRAVERVYARKEAIEIASVSAIVQKREQLIVTTRGRCGHMGGKGGGAE